MPDLFSGPSTAGYVTPFAVCGVSSVSGVVDDASIVAASGVGSACQAQVVVCIVAFYYLNHILFLKNHIKLISCVYVNYEKYFGF